MNKTNIEWVKNPDGTQGYTWNPITGCLNHDNGLCKGGGFPCYAYKLANGRLKSRYLANHNMVPFEKMEDEDGSDHWQFHDPFYPRFWEERLKDLPKIGLRVPWSKERGIFVCDMADLFGDCIPQRWQEQIFERIRCYQEHRFYLLTKQPQNLIRFSPFPENCWVGVTACNDVMYQAAMYYLNEVEARVKYISFEPLLSTIDCRHEWDTRMKRLLNWIILGAQTKPYKPPEIEWVREIVEAADKAGTPVFLKDNLLELVNYQSPETEFAFNKEGYYRQEMPDV